MKPTKREVLTYAACWYELNEANGWKDSRGLPIRDWKKALDIYLSWREGEPMPNSIIKITPEAKQFLGAAKAERQGFSECLLASEAIRKVYPPI